MGEIVNLRQVKKRAKRLAEAAEATRSRVISGRTKAEKLWSRQQEALRNAKLDGVRKAPKSAQNETQ